MIDLTTIKADNAKRRSHKTDTTPGPWSYYKAIWTTADRLFLSFARSDNAADVIDELVAEVERLRALTRDVMQCEEPPAYSGVFWERDKNE